MKKARLVSLLLALVLLLGLAVPAMAESEPMLSTELDEPVKFSYLRPVWGPPTYEKGNDYEKMLFEAANVEIDASIIPVADFDSKLPVLIAGGTDIDVIWNAGPANSAMREIYDQGAFLALDDLLEKYPDVKAAVADGVWDLTASSDGKHYFFPSPLSVFVPFPIYYRTDIFEELGLAIPTTVDELTECLRTIKAEKPDIIPLTVNELFSYWYFQNVANAFGYNFGWMPDPEDETRIIPSNITSNFRDFLEWINMLRKEDLIDPDFLIAAGKLGADTFKAGNAAVICINWNSYSDLLVELRKNVPYAGIGVITSIEGPGGVSGAKNLTGYDRGFSINVNSADKADDIFKFLNWLYTDGYTISRYGFEGYTYKYDEDGNIVSMSNDEREPGFQGPQVEPLSFPIKSDDTNPNWLDYYNQFIAKGLTAEDLDVMRLAFEDSVLNYSPDYDKQAYSPTQSSIGSVIASDYLTPTFEKLMIDPTADISIFDSAVEQWLANGGEQIIDEINEATAIKTAPVFTYEYTGPDYR